MTKVGPRRICGQLNRLGEKVYLSRSRRFLKQARLLFKRMPY